MTAPIPPPFRFLGGVLIGWTAIRTTALLLPDPIPVGTVSVAPAPRPAPAPAVDRRLKPPRIALKSPRKIAAHRSLRPRFVALRPLFSALPIRFGASPPTAKSPIPSAPEAAPVVGGLAPALQPPPPARPGRWHGSAWLYARGNGTLADPGTPQLGGSQAGARLAWRLFPDGFPISAAGRLYAPLQSLRGAEAALGFDLQPLPAAALRISAERRIALGRDGRNAWSAYAAGGAYSDRIPLGLEGDVYVQAGIVGARRRDLFADGALRLGRRLPLGQSRAVLLGAGLWGAAQPGVSRLDIGPRAALILPAGRATVSLAAEYRILIAGKARPGSGLALTLATDF